MKAYVKAFLGEVTFSDETAPGVIVEFGKPWRLIFWSKAQYVACWDLGGGVWFTPEWLETNSPEDLHCYEPIMDKKLKYTNVQIVEPGEVRAKVRWNYACCDVRYRVFNGNTMADEYYTVYPDGVAVRKLVAWPGDASDHGGNPNFWEVLEWILINAKGTTPDETLEKDEAFIFMNDKGDKITFKWPLPAWTGMGHGISLCKIHPEIADWNVYIGRISVKDRPDPYVIFARDKRTFPYRACSRCNKDHPHFGVFEGGNNIFKHWPVATMEDFILAVPAGDDVGKVTTHSSFANCQYSNIPGDRPPKPSVWLFLTGATNEPSEFLVELAKSWLNPAEIKTGYEIGPWGMAHGRVIFEGYMYSERAYTFRKYGEDYMKFKMIPKVHVINPVFVVNGWKNPSVNLILNGKVLEEDRFRWQQVGDDLIIWVDQKISEPTEVEITSNIK